MMNPFDTDRIKPLIDAVLGRSDSLTPTITPQMKTEMLTQMDPARLQRQAIGKGLIAAASKLGSTPGSFLTGLGQAAPVGAGAYVDARDSNYRNRLKTLGDIQKGAQEDEESTLNRLKTKIGVGRTYNQELRDQAQETREVDQAARDVEQHQFDLAKSDAELGEIYDKLVNDRITALKDIYPDNPEIIEQKIQEYSNALRDVLSKKRQQYGITGARGQDEETKVIDGITYSKRNGRWGILRK